MLLRVALLVITPLDTVTILGLLYTLGLKSNTSMVDISKALAL